MIWIFVGLVFLFGFVIFFGAPYLPTRRQQVDAALDLLNLKSGDKLIELGSGDGRVMRLAAARGYKVVGYELNPILVIISYVVTWKYRHQIKIIWGNFWNNKLPEADGIFTFLLDKYMNKLDKKVKSESKKPIKLASFAFKISNKKYSKTKNGIFLYVYN